jgi:hypothetical protein
MRAAGKKNKIIRRSGETFAMKFSLLNRLFSIALFPAFPPEWVDTRGQTRLRVPCSEEGEDVVISIGTGKWRTE